MMQNNKYTYYLQQVQCVTYFQDVYIAQACPQPVPHYHPMIIVAGAGWALKSLVPQLSQVKLIVRPLTLAPWLGSPPILILVLSSLSTILKLAIYSKTHF